MPRRRVAAVSTLALCLLALPAPSGAGAAVGPDRVAPSQPTDRAASGGLTHTVVSEGGKRYRLRLHPVDIRSPQFQVLVQRPDGSLRDAKVAPTRAYLGSVVGTPSAVAVAVRRRGGALSGQITVDGRATAFFDGSRVTGTRGTTPQPRPHWPSSDDAADNVTVRPGQVAKQTRRWDVGYDLDFSYLGGELRGSVARAMDEVELTTVELLATYETDGRLRPAIGRVVLRKAQAASPYAGREAELDDVRSVWRGAIERDRVDVVAYLHSDGDGGGVAYTGVIGGDYAVSLNGSGNDIAIIRHELGHSWGPGDNHTNGPEGPTIESGNDYARFDGTELAAILSRRDDVLAEQPRRFPMVATSRTTLPPYATLDLRDRVRSGSTTRLRPLANDVDANGDRLRLRPVPRRTHLGGRLVQRGNTVVYRAPRVRTARTLDWFRYSVVDATGRPASGVVLMRVSP